MYEAPKLCNKMLSHHGGSIKFGRCRDVLSHDELPPQRLVVLIGIWPEHEDRSACSVLTPLLPIEQPRRTIKLK
jgi:hypothetical protein